MTLVVAAQFLDGAIVLADSRATWTGGSTPSIGEDSLRKLLPIGPKGAFAFAGSVDVAAAVVAELRKRGRLSDRRARVRKVAIDLPRITKRCVEVIRAKRPKLDCTFEFAYAAVDGTGKARVWSAKTPQLNLQELKGGYLVLGSGGPIAEDFLAREFAKVSALPTLKSRADYLREGLIERLDASGETTVGGLLQVVTITFDGIRPMTYGSASLDPDDPGDGVDMQMEGGNWVQRSSAAPAEITLTEPSKLITQQPRKLVVRDFEPRTSAAPKKGKWFLSYFIPCAEVRRAATEVEFVLPTTTLGARTYPARFRLIAAIGFWGSPLTEQLTIRLELRDASTIVHAEPVKCDFPMEMIDLAVPIELPVDEAGFGFLECYIADQLLGRRPIFFGDLPSDLNLRDAAAVEKAVVPLREEFAKGNDARLGAAPSCGLAFWITCGEADITPGRIRFLHETQAVYWAKYPLNFRTHLVAGFRAAPGTHQVRVELVDMVTRASTIVATATVESESAATLVQIVAEKIFEIPRPAWYFVNLHCDGTRIASTVICAEGVRAKYSYGLRPEDVAHVAAGELLALARRARPSPGA